MIVDPVLTSAPKDTEPCRVEGTALELPLTVARTNVEPTARVAGVTVLPAWIVAAGKLTEPLSVLGVIVLPVLIPSEANDVPTASVDGWPIQSVRITGDPKAIGALSVVGVMLAPNAVALPIQPWSDAARLSW